MGFAIAYGALKKTTARLENDLDRLARQVESFPEKYVTLMYFQIAIDSIKEDHSQMRDDIKHILDLVLKLDEHTRRD